MWDWMIYQDITIGSMSHTWGDYECQKLAVIYYTDEISIMALHKQKQLFLRKYVVNVILWRGNICIKIGSNIIPGFVQIRSPLSNNL